MIAEYNPLKKYCVYLEGEHGGHCVHQIFYGFFLRLKHIPTSVFHWLYNTYRTYIKQALQVQGGPPSYKLVYNPINYRNIYHKSYSY